MSDKGCPSREALSAYLAGTLGGATAESVSGHLGGCSACQATLQTLSNARDTRIGRPPASGREDESPKGPRGGTPPKRGKPAPSGRPMAGGRLPSMSQPETPLLGQLGEYKLLQKLGEGGMGTVYKALHTELERVVALKVLPEGRMQDDHAVGRFKREMKAIGRLDHPNIVRAHDAREIDGTHFLVMEYVEGMDLMELSRRTGPMSIADACELIRQAAAGLEYAHQRGLVHRDVKPSNLMLTPHGQVKILDLGLARICGPGQGTEEMTLAGQAMGTPDYMAPEQASDSHMVDVRADLYSLGCTLYKLLCGRAPFSGPEYRSAFDKMTAHVRDPVPPIGQFRGDLPDDLVAVLDRLLAKMPDQRFATSGEVAEALARFTSGCDLPRLLAGAEGEAIPPVRSRPSSSAGPVPRPEVWWRQRPVIVAGVSLAAVGVLALVIALALSNGGDRATVNPPEAGPTVNPPDAAAVDSGREGTPGVEPAAGPPTPPGVRDWIVLNWTAPRMGKPDLWLFSPDGKTRLRVTNNPRAFDVQPKFSPDGRRIAFVRGLVSSESTGVWVCNTDGSDCRRLATPRTSSERLASPVWVSNSRVYYACDPKADREPDMEVWQADLDGTEPERVFSFQDALGQGGGLVTDVSPDGRQLAVIAQTEGLWPTADVYVTDLTGKLLHTVWSDLPDDRKDARALWSPDGKSIAWHHNFTAGSLTLPMHYGVGMARLGPDGQWTHRFQLNEKTFITPLAWAPHGRYLLCARIHNGPTTRIPGASLFLVDEQLQPVRVLFELEACYWQPPQRDFGRLADWAVLPADAALPPDDKPALPAPR